MFAQYKIVPEQDRPEVRANSRLAFDVDAVVKLERAAGQVMAREKERDRRRRAAIKHVISFWPFGVGIFLAFLAPLLHSFVAPWQPWGMWLVFPLVELVGRPEAHVNNQAAIQLQHIMVYAEFPLEGLIARWAIRQRVSFSGVASHLCFLHALGAVDLFLLSGVLNQIALR